MARFLGALATFLRKWRLAQLITWELPLPQGPLSDVPLGLAASLLGTEQPVSTVPPYYDIPSTTDVRGEIRDQQRQAALSAGVKPEHPLTDIRPRAGRPSGYEAAFSLWLVERAARGRYGDRRGLTVRLSRAFAAILGCTEERIKQIRKTYSPFLESAKAG